MLPGIGTSLDSGPPKGQDLEIVLFSAHARISGSVNLGAYTRLSDLLSFHDDILALSDAVVLTQAGESTADRAPQLDVRLELSRQSGRLRTRNPRALCFQRGTTSEMGRWQPRQLPRAGSHRLGGQGATVAET